MKKHTLLRWGFVVAMVSIPWLYLIILWPALPATIPVHFDLHGDPDKFGPKQDVFIGPAVCSAASLLMYLLLTNIYKLDPKRQAASQPGLFTRIAMAVVVFLSCVAILILNWAARQHTASLHLFLVMMGLLFAYLGNIMHSLKPNYFAGFRLPWTLESEDNWKATHRIVSKIWFGGGLLIALLALFVPPFPMFFMMMAIVLAMVAIPIVYSYRYFKHHKPGNSLPRAGVDQS
ncbi:MAG TPA: SdpI family protein [Chitinophagaceae bacterium]